MPAGPTRKKRSIIYVDGFNFYYGVIKGGPNKWLNLESFFNRLLPNNDIQIIRYFTALVNGPSQARQKVYLQALPLNLLSSSRFPSQVPDGLGGVITKPAGW